MKPTGRGARTTALGIGLAACLVVGSPPALAQKDRLDVWDLKIGATLDRMPDEIEFKGYACGSNGGPPRQRLDGWKDFKTCTPEPTGLYEVYFEYDDEAEYILRALNDFRVARYVGTTDKDFPVVTSALFDADGILRGVRVVTDPRADYTKDDFFELDSLRRREDHYLLGPFLGAQFQIDAEKDCVKRPLAEGESEIGTTFVKLDCDKTDEKAGLRYILQTRFFRKPGQYGRDRFDGQLTHGQFESQTRAEVYQIGYGPEKR